MVTTSSGTGDGSFTKDEISCFRRGTLAFDCLLSFSGTAPDEFPKSMWIDGRCQIVEALEILDAADDIPKVGHGPNKAKPGHNSTRNIGRPAAVSGSSCPLLLALVERLNV